MDEDSVHQTGNFWGCAGSLALLSIGALLLVGGLLTGLPEGPHGPNGEITADPSLTSFLPWLCGSGLILGFAGLLLLVWTFGSKQKR